jgi:signal transduction histidine kinase
MRFKPYAESGTNYLRQISILHSEGFRLAASFAALFLGLAVSLIAAVLWIVDDTQTSALRRANDSDIATIQNAFRDEGFDEAVEVTRQRLGRTGSARGLPPGAYILVEDQTSGKVAGNLASFAPRVGVFDLPVPDSAQPGAAPRPRGGRILGRGAYLAPGVYVFVGRDTGEIAATRIRIMRAFAWVVAGSILFAGVGGTLLRLQLTRRVDAITRTCESIIAGRFNERIPVRSRGDELERLSIAINEMLNRISALLDNLRQVSSDVAHDLRTPLTRLRNRLEDARLGAVTTTDYAAAVTRAIEDTDQVLSIFSALLRISQIEAGTRMATFAQLSLTKLLEGVVEMYRPVAEDHHHVLSANIQSEVDIRGDAELLTQMFSNLIENAIRHTPLHTHIRVGLQSSGDAIVASVSDDGPGIPAQEHAKVLRRFYRLSGSRSTAGHGLGLALVAAIANLHQATLELHDGKPGLCVSANFY